MPARAASGKAAREARRRVIAQRKAESIEAAKKALEDAERARLSLDFDPELDASEFDRRKAKIKYEQAAAADLLVLEQHDKPIEAVHIPISQRDDVTTFEVVLLGSGGGGKTALLQQYLNQFFPQKYVPTVLEEYWVPMHFDHRDIMVHIWDSAGQELCRCVPEQYNQEGMGFIIVYSVTNELSFRQSELFRKTLEENREPNDKVPVMLVANQTDVSSEMRQVSKQAGESKAQRWKTEQAEVRVKKKDTRTTIFGQTQTQKEEAEAAKPKNSWTGQNKLGKIMYTEVSALEGRGVANVFESILKVLIRQDDEKREAEANRGSMVVQHESETRCDIL